MNFGFLYFQNGYDRRSVQLYSYFTWTWLEIPMPLPEFRDPYIGLRRMDGLTGRQYVIKIDLKSMWIYVSPSVAENIRIPKLSYQCMVYVNDTTHWRSFSRYYFSGSGSVHKDSSADDVNYNNDIPNLDYDEDDDYSYIEDNAEANDDFNTITDDEDTNNDVDINSSFDDTIYLEDDTDFVDTNNYADTNNDFNDFNYPAEEDDTNDVGDINGSEAIDANTINDDSNFEDVNNEDDANFEVVDNKEDDAIVAI